MNPIKNVFIGVAITAGVLTASFASAHGPYHHNDHHNRRVPVYGSFNKHNYNDSRGGYNWELDRRDRHYDRRDDRWERNGYYNDWNRGGNVIVLPRNHHRRHDNVDVRVCLPGLCVDFRN